MTRLDLGLRLEHTTSNYISDLTANARRPCLSMHGEQNQRCVCIGVSFKEQHVELLCEERGKWTQHNDSSPSIPASNMVIALDHLSTRGQQYPTISAWSISRTRVVDAHESMSLVGAICSLGHRVTSLIACPWYGERPGARYVVLRIVWIGGVCLSFSLVSLL
jgi:hypothetical protein